MSASIEWTVIDKQTFDALRDGLDEVGWQAGNDGMGQRSITKYGRGGIGAAPLLCEIEQRREDGWGNLLRIERTYLRNATPPDA